MIKEKNLNLNRKNTANYVPLLSLDKARRSYFIHESRVHSVALCSAETFRAAIRALIDTKQLADSNMLLEATDVLNGPDDLYSRWWLLCYAAKAMRLFASRAEAMAFNATTAQTR